MFEAMTARTVDSSSNSTSGRGDGPIESPFPKLADFEILNIVGEGGMGVVYRARQRGLKRLVAVKVIRTKPGVRTKDAERLRIEAQAIARLQHRNIVQIHEIGEDDGLLYIALEFVDGLSLDKVLQEHAIDPRQAAKLVETLAHAMQHVHDQGIIHRDLKPSNVLMAKSSDSTSDELLPWPKRFHPDIWTAKITDFGLAKLQDDDTGLSSSKALLGTPNYMSPEQARADGTQVGPAADVYGLGTILYELLTRRPPVLGSNMLEVLQRVGSQEPTPPTQLDRAIPRDLETICLKCLQKDPQQRYGNARELAEDLGRFLAFEPIAARPANLVERAVKWCKRHPTITGLACAIAIAALLFSSSELRHLRTAHVREKQVRVDERNEQLEKLADAQAAYRRFGRLHADAVFVGYQAKSLGEFGSTADREQLLALTNLAFREVGLDVDADSGPRLNPYWSEREKADVMAGCFELYLAYADNVANACSSKAGENQSTALQEALTILDRAANLFPHTQAIALQRARCFEQAGDRHAAHSALEDALKVPPTTSIDFRLLGSEQHRRGEVAAAAMSLQKALVLDRTDFWSRFLLSVCELKLGRPTEAESDLTICLQQRPDFLWGLLMRGMARARTDAFDGAEADFRAALELRPGVDARYAVQVSRGMLRLKRERWREAEVDLKLAIELKPKQFHAGLALARMYQARKDYSQSNAEFDRILKLNPPAAIACECHSERSRNSFLCGDFATSEVEAQAACTAQPDNATAHEAHAFALLELRRFAESLQALERFAAYGGKPGPDFYRARGRARMQLGDFLSAKDDFTRALENRSDAQLLRYRGWAYFFADAGKPALRDFDGALALDPNCGETYVGRGLTYCLLGLTHEAIADARKAEVHGVDTPEMSHNLACIYAQAAEMTEKPGVDNATKSAASELRNSAFAAIRKSLKLVPERERSRFWREKIRPDAALKSLRDSDEFRRIDRIYSAKAVGSN